MALQATEVVKLYYSTSSPTTVIREMAKRHPDQKKLSKMQVRRIIHRFERTGSIEDGRHSNSGRPKAVRSAENNAGIYSVIEKNTPEICTKNSR